MADNITIQLPIVRKAQTREYLSNEEKLHIGNLLADYHKCFYIFFTELSGIFFDESCPTAGVYFSKYNKPYMVLGKDFWADKTDKEKAFIIVHECMHILLKHDIRNGKNIPGSNRILVNQAQDIVINEMIISRFDYDREDFRGWQKYCWIDTLFKNPAEIEKDREFVYYLEKLIKEVEKKKKENKEKGEKGEGQSGEDQGEQGAGEPGTGELMDDHNDSYEEVFDENGEVRGSKPSEEKGDDENQEKGAENLTKKVIDQLTPKQIDELMKKISHGPGLQGTLLESFKEKTKPPKLDFACIVAGLKATREKEDETEVESFKMRSRRFASIMSQGARLPGRYEDVKRLKKKFHIAVMMDVSGSCIPYLPDFKKVAQSFQQESNLFDVSLFTFDTVVTKIDKVLDFYAGGGNDSNRILEDECQRIKQETGRYPDGVILITDGYFFNEVIVPEHPNRWIWLKTAHFSDKYVHQKSRSFDISKITYDNIKV